MGASDRSRCGSEPISSRSTTDLDEGAADSVHPLKAIVQLEGNWHPSPMRSGSSSSRRTGSWVRRRAPSAQRRGDPRDLARCSPALSGAPRGHQSGAVVGEPVLVDGARPVVPFDRSPSNRRQQVAGLDGLVRDRPGKRLWRECRAVGFKTEELVVTTAGGGRHLGEVDADSQCSALVRDQVGAGKEPSF